MRFGYEGKPNTCLWCGQPFAPAGTEHHHRAHKGANGVPLFHSGGCAERFGKRAAELGYRMVRRATPGQMFAAAHGVDPHIKIPITPLPPETPEERARNLAQKCRAEGLLK